MSASGFADGATISLRVGPGPEPATDLWFAIAVAAMVLIAAGLLAWWRARSEFPQPRRRSRILWASAACSAGLALIMIPTQFASTGLNDGDVGLHLVLGFVLGLIPATMLFGTADLMLDYFRPRRTLIWLVISPFLFTAFIVGILAMSDWLQVLDTSRTGPAPIAAVLAAGLVWWSFLPKTGPRPPDSRIARIFD